MALQVVFVVLLAGAGAAPTAWRALSYNLLHEQADLAASLDVIGRADADVVCVQELTPRFARAFAARFGRVYPHRRFEEREGTWGVGVASRHPLEDAEVFAQSPHRMPAVQATVVRGGERVTVVCVHLFPPGARRRKEAGLLGTMRENAELRVQQADGLARRLAARRGPLLLLGDFNEADDDAAVKRLRDAGFAVACDIDGERCGGTYPGGTSLWPAVFQVDHILGRGLRFHRAEVRSEGSSDHYPIVAEFTLGE
jgi:endonuclease/exonuclease/phosphatase (EEP) superfamily protein YafD